MALISNPAIEKILEAFDIKGQYKVTALGKGHINDTYLLSPINEKTAYKCVLQRVNHGVFKAPGLLMENIRVIRSHIEKLYCTPVELKLLNYHKTTDGKFLYKDDEDNYWRINHFIENTYTVEHIEKPDQAFEAARAFGKFIWNLRELPPTSIHHSIPDFHNAKKRMNQFHSSLREDRFNRVSHAVNEVSFVSEHEKLVDEVEELISSHQMPERITHNDTKLNNVLFSRASGKVISVIDLDTVMPGYLIYDFGDIVRTFTPSVAEDDPDVFKVNMRLEIFKTLTQGFLAATEDLITHDEIEHLVLGGKLMTFIQGVRFLTDFIEGDHYYYKISRKTQNLGRAKNQFELLASIIEQEAEMKSWVEKCARDLNFNK